MSTQPYSTASSSSSSAGQGASAEAIERVKAQIMELAKSNPNSEAMVTSISPDRLAGVIIRHTKKTTLPEDDDNYDSEEDDFDENHAESLPQPTPTSEVEALVEGEIAQDVVLWRGASPAGAQAMASNGSAGGAAADPEATAVDEATRKKQVGSGGTAPEFTSDPELLGFSRDNWLVVVQINTRYLAKGSATESGWVAPPSAPVRVLAMVDRTRNKQPGTRANAS